MAITPQHEKGEATEADLEHAYDKARSIGLFLMEKYARQALRNPHNGHLKEFVVSMGVASFWDDRDEPWSVADVASELSDLLREWDDALKLTGEPMRFTVDGPVRREW